MIDCPGPYRLVVRASLAGLCPPSKTGRFTQDPSRKPWQEIIIACPNVPISRFLFLPPAVSPLFDHGILPFNMAIDIPGLPAPTNTVACHISTTLLVNERQSTSSTLGALRSILVRVLDHMILVQACARSKKSWARLAGTAGMTGNSSNPESLDRKRKYQTPLAQWQVKPDGPADATRTSPVSVDPRLDRQSEARI